MGTKGVGGGGEKKGKDSRQAPTWKTKGAVDRRQNSRMLKAASARHCAATTVRTQLLLPQLLCGTVTKTVRSSAVGNQISIC